MPGNEAPAVEHQQVTILPCVDFSDTLEVEKIY